MLVSVYSHRRVVFLGSTLCPAQKWCRVMDRGNVGVPLSVDPGQEPRVLKQGRDASHARICLSGGSLTDENVYTKSGHTIGHGKAGLWANLDSLRV